MILKLILFWCQRETVIESLYRGSSSPFIYKKRFKTFYLIGGGNNYKIKMINKNNVISYDDPILKEQTKQNFNEYKKILLDIDKTRNVNFINFKTFIKPYGSGYELFGIKNYEPYTGFLMTIYFDNLYPNEKKTLIGFNCYQDRIKKININRPRHMNLLDYNLLKSYCKIRKIEFRFSNIKDNILIDENISDFEPLFELKKKYIDIENPNSNDIIMSQKLKNYL